MRRSLLMAPAASCGTLKSTRTRTRLPRRPGRSRRAFLGTDMDSPAKPQAAVGLLIPADHVAHQIDAALRAAPRPLAAAHAHDAPAAPVHAPAPAAEPPARA